MENQEREQIEEQIRKNEEEISRIKEQIAENDKKIENEKRLIRQTKKKIMINTIKMFYNTTSFYLIQVLKSPIYLLSILFIFVCMVTNWYNLRTIVTKLALKQYSKEEASRIYNYYDELTNHATWIFYILIMVYYIILK